MVWKKVVVCVVSSVCFAMNAGWGTAADAVDSGQPASRIGLVKDHSPVKYEGDIIFFADGKLAGYNKYTQTWSTIERKEGKAEHAMKIETHTIHSENDPKNAWTGKIFKDDMDDSVIYELFHQDEKRDIVLDAIIGRNGKPETLQIPEEHYIIPGTLAIGTKWRGDHVLSSMTGVYNLEVIGSEVFNGVNCWTIKSTREPMAIPLTPNSKTITWHALCLYDPLTLTFRRTHTTTEGIGPKGRKFKIIGHLEVVE